ncbi:MAG: cysteine desulfurase [Planctomycetaceae bacterium]|nr:cysteine desulfurase [Planctomycetaceae bacterium]
MIYLDHNATTPILPEVLDEMCQVWTTASGNPGSRHVSGRKARQVMETAREQLAELLDAEPTEIVFTSGGTESINLALTNFAAGRKGVMVSLPGEHPATEATLQHWTSPERPIHRLPLDSTGQLIDAALDEVPWSQAILATALLAHNETGVIQDLTRLGECCQQHRVPWHVDAVQAVGKIPVSFRQLGCTTLSLGAHKFGGPRGIGALLVRQGVRLAPSLFGGHQEAGLRPGTEPVAMIAGLAKALSVCVQQQTKRSRIVSELRDRLQAGLTQQAAPVLINGIGAPRLPNTLNIAFPGCTADALLVALDLAGICGSLGSACASGSTQPSPILTAMGCPPMVLSSSLRLSLGWQTTGDEIDDAVRIISEVVARLRH